MNPLESIIGIYILIGVANYAAHVLTCGACQRNLFGMVLLFAHGVIDVCGWPYHLYLHFTESNDDDEFVLTDREKELVMFNRIFGKKIHEQMRNGRPPSPDEIEEMMRRYHDEIQK